MDSRRQWRLFMIAGWLASTATTVPRFHDPTPSRTTPSPNANGGAAAAALPSECRAKSEGRRAASVSEKS